MAKQLHPSSLAYWSEGKLKKKIQIYSKQEAFYTTFTAEELSSSGDVYALGSVSASNNLAIGGNAQVSGSLSASLVYAYALANAQNLKTITIPANYNSVLYGPISIEAGETLTIGVDSNVKIVDIADV